MGEARRVIRGEDKRSPERILLDQDYLKLQLQFFQPHLVCREKAPERATKAAFEEILRDSVALSPERLNEYEKKLEPHGLPTKQIFFPLLKKKLFDFLAKENNPITPDEQKPQNFEAAYNTLINLAIVAPLNPEIKNRYRRLATSDGYQFDGVKIREALEATTNPVKSSITTSILEADDLSEKLRFLSMHLTGTPIQHHQTTVPFVNPITGKSFYKRDLERIKSFKTPVEAAIAEKARIKREAREVWTYPGVRLSLFLLISSILTIVSGFIWDQGGLAAIGGCILLVGGWTSAKVVKNACAQSIVDFSEIDELIKQLREAERLEEEFTQRLEATDKIERSSGLAAAKTGERKTIPQHDSISSLSSSRFEVLQRSGFAADLREPFLKDKTSLSREDEEIRITIAEPDYRSENEEESKEELRRPRIS